jgi:hypothetical protein
MRKLAAALAILSVPMVAGCQQRITVLPAAVPKRNDHMAQPPAVPTTATQSATRRCLLARIQHPSFTEKGPSILFYGDDTEAKRLDPPVELPVVADGPERVRTIVEDWRTRLLVFFDRGDLSSTPLAQTVVVPDPKWNGSTGLRVAPGVPLELGERQDTQRHVRGRAGGIEFEGWVPDDGVGTMFEPKDFPPLEANVDVSAGSTILAEDADGAPGPTIARIAAREHETVSAYADASMTRADGLQRVHIVTPTVDLLGLVASARLRPRSPTRWYRGHAPWAFGISSARERILPAGAPIYATEDQSFVGVVLRSVRVYEGTDRGDMVDVLFVNQLLGRVVGMVPHEAPSECTPVPLGGL